MSRRISLRAFGFSLSIFCVSACAHGGVISFSNADFVVTPDFSNVQTFSFTIDIAGPLTPGVYNNPVFNSVVYNVFGSLASGTPSGFSAFNLERTITGAEFYSQGSSLNFEISAGADLSDGLQVDELVGANPVFVFNGREVGTGRYHPALLVLNSDGTGSIRNSNNTGGINSSSMEEVDVDFGEEYITNLTFDASQLTLAVAVPEPSSLMFLGTVGVIGMLLHRRRKKTPS